VFLPAFWMLVPGSLGLLSVTELALDRGGSGFVVVELIGAIALGLLFGSVLARSFRRLIRSSRAHEAAVRGPAHQN
jgi:uncharacterized membrane protein YjjB (DUF3815 family)